MTPVKVVAGIIEDEAGRVLIAQRPPGKRLAGMWEFPGGKIEAGEAPDAALKRELKEELELDIRPLEDLGKYAHVYDWGAIELHVFRVHALAAPVPTEHIQVFRWLKAKDIALKDFAPADHAPLEAYLRKISGP
jgi:8-oxo-dGTP diphosphatase